MMPAHDALMGVIINFPEVLFVNIAFNSCFAPAFICNITSGYWFSSVCSQPMANTKYIF